MLLVDDLARGRVEISDHRIRAAAEVPAQKPVLMVGLHHDARRAPRAELRSPLLQANTQEIAGRIEHLTIDLGIVRDVPDEWNQRRRAYAAQTAVYPPATL